MHFYSLCHPVSGIYSEVDLLHHVLILCLTFLGSTWLFSMVAEQSSLGQSTRGPISTGPCQHLITSFFSSSYFSCWDRFSLSPDWIECSQGWLWICDLLASASSWGIIGGHYNAQFMCAGDWTQSFVYASQAVYQLRCFSDSPFFVCLILIIV